MKVLLLQPNYDAHVVHPPLGLGYLASFLRQNGHPVSIFDGTLENALITSFVDAVRDGAPDLVGITVLSRGHHQVKKIIGALKQNFKSLPVVIGGTQVTAAPSEALLDLGADFAVIGEGEATLLELVESLGQGKLSLKEIAGLAYKRPGGKVRANPPRRLIDDLDALPFPAWDLMPPARYRIVPILEPARATPVAPILTSRGCPYNCSFCASNVTWRRKIRFRSPENVLAEIKLLKNDFGVKEIHFSDDNFTIDTARAEAICDRMIREAINLPWQCPNGVRIDRLTRPLLKKMRQSGCYALGLGIESGDQEVLKKVSKHLDLGIVPSVLRDLKEVGIESYGFFILGLPGDTRPTIEATINFALSHPFDRAWFNLFTPYPGSAAFSDWLGGRSFSSINWETHDCSTAVAKVSGVSLRELEALQKKALLRFYGRPRVIVSILSRLGPRELTTILMSRFFGKLLRPLSALTHRRVRTVKRVKK